MYYNTTNGTFASELFHWDYKWPVCNKHKFVIFALKTSINCYSFVSVIGLKKILESRLGKSFIKNYQIPILYILYICHQCTTGIIY